MNKEYLKDIVSDLAEDVKTEAIKAVKDLGTDELREYITAEIVVLIKPLEDEIKNTSSIWVKMRNRIYINALNHAVDLILTNLQKNIDKL